MDPTIISVMGNNFIKATGEIMTPETFKNPPKVGISGIIKELGDPDVQRALGFIFLILKALGRSIDTSGKQLTALEETARGNGNIKEGGLKVPLFFISPALLCLGFLSRVLHP
jgi:hypothetical protein